MTQSLYAIESEALAVERMLVESGGEITPEIEAWLEQVDTQLANKIDAYDTVMTRMEATINRLSAAANERRAAAAQIAALHERLKSRIKSTMRRLGKNRIEGDQATFQLARVKSKLELVPASLPESHFMPVTDLVPDKERIRKDLESGLEINGAWLEESFALRITPKK